MTGGLRRHHTKSRLGCSQCKKKRKKCDMRMPRCGNCSKWKTECDFTAFSNAVRPVYERAFAQRTAAAPALPADGRLAFPLPLPSFETEDMELLRHYATHSSLTLSPRHSLPVFQENVPGEAKSHIYLMHSVLAFSALHLAFVDYRNRGYLSYVASRQHQRALTAFRDSVKEVNLENGGPITAFSFLTVVYTLGLPIVFGFENTPSPMSTFIEVLQVLRGAWTAIGPALGAIETGTLSGLIKPPPHERTMCDMHAKGAKVVKFLDHFLRTSPICEEENKHIYREALANWLEFFMNSPCRPPLWANALVWPMTVSQPFFQLLLEKRPCALILLANWSIGLFRAPNMWFNAWAKEVIADIWYNASEEAKPALMWPVEITGVIPKTSHPGDCLCWACHEGGSYVQIRDAAAAVLVDRTRPEANLSSDEGSVSPEVRNVTPERWL